MAMANILAIGPLLDVTELTSLRYETLIDFSVCKALIRTAIEIWEKLGFTYGMEDEEKKAQLSVAYSNITYMRVNDDERINRLFSVYGYDDEGDYFMDTMVYPLMRRVATDVEYFDFDKFLNLLEKVSFLHYVKSPLVDEDDIDSEAEYIALLSHIIVTIWKKSEE